MGIISAHNWGVEFKGKSFKYLLMIRIKGLDFKPLFTSYEKLKSNVEHLHDLDGKRILQVARDIIKYGDLATFQKKFQVKSRFCHFWRFFSFQFRDGYF